MSTDAITAPTPEMWQLMEKTATERYASSSLHSDAVDSLRHQVRLLTGKEAMLLLPSCTMANLVAMMAQTSRGEQVIMEESSHISWSEGWGFGAIAGLVPRRIQGSSGRIHTDDLVAAIHDQRFGHRPRSTLLCLENTHNAAGGTVLTAEYTSEICAIARQHGLAIHLDGARLPHAAIYLRRPVSDLTTDVDSVAISLNKGLSCLEGVVLCGPSEFIEKAERIAKMLGGGSMHHAGVIAAAGSWALHTMFDRLEEDHRRARSFAELLHALPGVGVELAHVQTHIVMAKFSAPGLDGQSVYQRLKKHGVIAYPYKDDVLRFVFHRHIDDEDAQAALEAIRKVVTLGR